MTILETFGAPLDAVANAVGGGCAAISAAFFLHRHFSLGRVPRILTGAVSAVATIGVVLAADRFSPVAVRAQVELALNAIVSTYILARCALVFRAHRDSDAILLGTGVATLVTAAVGNAVGLVPATFVAAALVLNAATGASVLAAGYVASLRKADARLAEVDARNREIDLLNVELRRQLADRSKELVNALVRVGALPTRSFHLGPDKVVRDRYRVVRPLGEGGMGAVYEVVRLADSRAFALKVLTGAGSGASLARFAQEAQIAATLHHPNLVAIVDVDVAEEGVLFLVMELVPGAPVSDLLDACRDRALLTTILHQVATGLVALHAAKIVHRDLKPANILVDRTGQEPHAKIADFGIARLDDNQPRVDPEAATSPVERHASMGDTVDPWGQTVEPTGFSVPLTATGALMGTPLYMAPELARRQAAIAPSSDIWSYGILALELWNGVYPFTIPPILRAFGGRSVVDPLELQAALAQVPSGWSRLLASCLEDDATMRPTAVTLKEEIARLLALSDRVPLAGGES